MSVIGQRQAPCSATAVVACSSTWLPLCELESRCLSLTHTLSAGSNSLRQAQVPVYSSSSSSSFITSVVFVRHNDRVEPRDLK